MFSNRNNEMNNGEFAVHVAFWTPEITQWWVVLPQPAASKTSQWTALVFFTTFRRVCTLCHISHWDVCKVSLTLWSCEDQCAPWGPKKRFYAAGGCFWDLGWVSGWSLTLLGNRTKSSVLIRIAVWMCLQDVHPSMGLWNFGDWRNVQTHMVSLARFSVREEIKRVPLVKNQEM